MTFADINIRDPFVLTDDGKYYLYGTRGADAWVGGSGFDVYVSSDLENWSGPHEVFKKTESFWAEKNFWAPEVHKYKGKYYMFASFKRDDRCRGTQILVSDSPMGPFSEHSNGPVTPAEWESLDGTFYVDKNGNPYMVFCHEWTQIKDGQICAIKLSDDLSRAEGEAVTLLTASHPSWARKGHDHYVTDGPFMYRTKSGRLLMIWSSFTDEGYCEAISYSDNGEITGNWLHEDKLLFRKDGGHGMLFKSNDGELNFIFHTPNENPKERPCIRLVEEKNDTLCVK